MDATLPRPDLDDSDFEGLSSWGLRVGMASMGWRSEVSIEKWAIEGDPEPETLDVGVSLTHNAWHGTLAEVRVGGKQRHVVPDDVPLVVCSMLGGLGALARRAWREWPHAVPFLMDGAMFVEHTRETEYFRSYPGPRVVRPERSRPTEALPGWPGQPHLAEFLDEGMSDGEAWLRHALDFVVESERGCWRDSLNPFGQPDPFNHLDRMWRFELTPRLRRWGGLRIGQMSTQFRCLQLTTGDVSINGVARACSAVADGHRSMLSLYPPGCGRLPPGMEEYVEPQAVPDFAEEPDLPSP